MPLERVKKFLSRYPDLQIILFNSSTHTSELAAQALGVTPAQIAKTLCFLADGRPVLLTTCGDTRVTQMINCQPLESTSTFTPH